MSIIRNKILKHTYNDSIVLMQHTVELESMQGVAKAAIMMGTPAILQYLKEENLLVGEGKDISADDMVIAAEGESEAEVDAAIAAIVIKLTGQGRVSGQPTTSDGRLAKDTAQLLWRDIPEEVKLSLISVPGRYAAAEAWRAIKNNNHVMLFSNGVSLEDELALKEAARERNLLVMGPDCGTAIINGVPLGFANRVRQGNIGIIAGAGSGLQELTCLIDRMGCGISHAIGTGGRDLSAEVGGITTAMGLEFLKNDHSTDLVLLLSKPPNPQVASKILKEAKEIGKPVAVCYIGYEF